MDAASIVIRIKTPTGDMDSSVDCPSLLNFNDLLVSPQMLQAATVRFDLTDWFFFIVEICLHLRHVLGKRL